jgi:PEP-CTERM motif
MSLFPEGHSPSRIPIESFFKSLTIMKSSVLALAFTAFVTGSASAAVMTMTNVSGGRVLGGTYNVGVVGTAAGVNNWPGGETPPMAHDGNTATKYLNFFEIDTGIVVSPDAASASLMLNSLSFTTANDAPERDPLTFSLFGSLTPLSGDFAISTLTPIVTGATTGLGTDPGRFTAGGPQTFTNNTAYASYLLIFPTVRDAGAANSMQIGEITFDGIPEPGTAALAAMALLGLVRRKR